MVHPRVTTVPAGGAHPLRSRHRARAADHAPRMAAAEDARWLSFTDVCWLQVRRAPCRAAPCAATGRHGPADGPRPQAHPLTEETALEYFALSPFYERTCNNEVARMQGHGPEHLVHMVGIEYAVPVPAQHAILVIRKLYRRAPDDGPSGAAPTRRTARRSRCAAVPLASYYILGGVIYQAPDLQSVLAMRLVRQAVRHRGAVRSRPARNRAPASAVWTGRCVRPQPAPTLRRSAATRGAAAAVPRRARRARRHRRAGRSRWPSPTSRSASLTSMPC